MLLSHCLEEAMGLDGVDVPACRHLCERIAEGRFNLVVAGEFNRGKSSVINALLGAAVLPVAVIPLTSVLTVIRHGERDRATVHFRGGEPIDIAPDEMAAFVTERGNPGNGKGVEFVNVEHPSPWLGAGIWLVDTPGIGSVHQHNSDVTYRYLPQADAVLFVVSVDQPLGRAELDFLLDIRRHAGKVLCLLNKADQVTADELREAEAFITSAVHDALGAPVPVIPLSARHALAGLLQGDAALVERSGLSALQEALQRLLGEERRAIWLDSLSRGFLRILSRARLGVGLELKSLSDPIEQIEAKLELFAGKKRDAMRMMSDGDILVDAEMKKLVKAKIEPDLERFKTALQASLAVGIDSRCSQLKRVRSKIVQTELEDYVVGAVRAAYDEWREGEEAEVGREFEALRERFWRDVEGVVDELLKQSAELFSLAYETERSGPAWRPQPAFRYKFWSEPTGLSLLGTSLLGRLPRAVGAALIRERAKRRAADLIDMQGGRVRHDFEERLKAMARELRSELRDAMMSTLDGIESAVASGTSMRRRGEADAAERGAKLTRAMARIEALEARVNEVSP